MGVEPTVFRLEGGRDIHFATGAKHVSFELIVVLNIYFSTYDLRTRSQARTAASRDLTKARGRNKSHRSLHKAAAPIGLTLLLLRVAIELAL